MEIQTQPLAVRFFHWIMVICIIILTFTGLYIYSPMLEIRLSMRFVRIAHHSAGIILLVNSIGQLYYYMANGNYKEVLFLPGDVRNMRSFFRYSLFITERHPNFGRYNPGQKLIFTSWWLMVAMAGCAGIVMQFPDHAYSVFFQRWVMELQTLRMTFLLITAYFVATIPLHLYLVFTESPANLQAMFTGYVQKESKGQQEK